MTPMVDLGFLLITFFIFTTVISTPTVTKLIMPDDTPTPFPTKIKDGLALTVLLADKNTIYYYKGTWDNAKSENQVFKTGFSYSNGIGNIIREMQKDIDEKGEYPEGRNGLMLIIKPGDNATYENLVDILDEVLINDVRKYAIVKQAGEEKELCKQ